MLKDGGTLCIVLPETVFHAPKMAYLRHFLLRGNNLAAIIDLPHNTFRPHCNAKTILLSLQKGVPQQEYITMATPREMGHDRRGRPLFRYGSNELWDDLAEVLDELDMPRNQQNKHVFCIHYSEFNPDILIPRYYRKIETPPIMPKGCIPVLLGQL